MLEKVIKPELRIRALRALNSRLTAVAVSFHATQKASGSHNQIFFTVSKILSVSHTEEKAQSLVTTGIEPILLLNLRFMLKYYTDKFKCLLDLSYKS